MFIELFYFFVIYYYYSMSYQRIPNLIFFIMFCYCMGGFWHFYVILILVSSFSSIHGIIGRQRYVRNVRVYLWGLYRYCRFLYGRGLLWVVCYPLSGVTRQIYYRFITLEVLGRFEVSLNGWTRELQPEYYTGWFGFCVGVPDRMLRTFLYRVYRLFYPIGFWAPAGYLHTIGLYIDYFYRNRLIDIDVIRDYYYIVRPLDLCAVCLDNNIRSVRTLPCRHAFCRGCVRLLNPARCPLCRALF